MCDITPRGRSDWLSKIRKDETHQVHLYYSENILTLLSIIALINKGDCFRGFISSVKKHN